MNDRGVVVNRWLLSVLALVFVAAACGGESGDVYGELGSSAEGDGVAAAGDDDDGSAASGGGVAAGDYADLGAEGGEVDEQSRSALVDFFEGYRWAADYATTGREGEDLSEFAGPEVVAQYEAMAAENEAVLAEDPMAGDLISWSGPEVISVQGSVDDAVVTSCNEVWADRDLGSTFRYEIERVRIESVDGDWLVTEREILHDGSPDEPTLGCLQERFAVPAREVMEKFLADYYESYRNPANPVQDALDLLDDELRADMRSELEAFVQQGVVVDVPVEQTIEVLGADNFWQWRVFVIEVCTTYPEGLGVKDADSGEWVGDVNFVGESLSVDYRLWFSLPEIGEDPNVFENQIWDRSQPVPVEGCEGGS